jgi:hypothetical protein
VVSEWPPRPANEQWPPVLTATEACQYLRPDQSYKDVASAKATLRHIRRTQNLPDSGRIGATVLFRKVTIDAWLRDRERANGQDR